MSIADDLKRERLKNSLGLKVDQYKQVGAALLITMNPADKANLQLQLDQLEAEIEAIEEELLFLPQTDVVQKQQQSALNVAQAEAQSVARQPRHTGRLINSLPRRYDGTTAFYDRTKEQADIQSHIQRGTRLISIHARALAQAGLALIKNGVLDAARSDYEAALAQYDAKGVIRKELRLLKELGKTPNGERLAPLLTLLRAKL